MSDDNERQEDATTADLSRQGATSDDSEYSLSVEEVLARYEAAGLPRTPRSIQRYCRKGYLEAHRAETEFGERFLIKPESVDRHIAYIMEVRPVATGRDLPRHVATTVTDENAGEQSSEATAAGGDNQRHVATEVPVSPPVADQGRVIELLESANEFLKGQIAVKDEQIKDLAEHARSTNLVIAGIAHKLPLLGVSDRGHEEARTYSVDQSDNHSTR